MISSCMSDLSIRFFHLFSSPGRHSFDGGFPQIGAIIIVEEFLTSLSCHVNAGISKKNGLHLSQEDLKLTKTGPVDRCITCMFDWKIARFCGLWRVPEVFGPESEPEMRFGILCQSS